ncbi:hypothetical protein SLS60_001283 [Paraconiothyrium brasiliense]|uniref:Uncharacterized protein n=1 Tax=Paraconiothyrium brasiliense TaxID=300254 RepID=A0ABR3S8M5_9PLEO
MSMLLTIILAAGPEQSQRTLSPLGIALVEKQGQLSMPATQCTHIPGSRTPFPSVSLFEQQCTPISGLPLQDWRGRLKNELENQASFQSDSLIRAVVQICHDLESRCDTIEGPLRVERERTTALEEELSRSRACVESLEQKRVDDSLYLGTLEAEKTQLEKDNDDLHARLENLRIELDKSNLQADTALREAREAEEAYNDTEMRLRSVILQHEETIEIEVKKQEALREKTAALDDALGKQEVEMHELANQYDDLQSRFEKEQDALEHQRQTNIRLEGRCTDLQNSLFEAERGLDEAKQSTLHKEEEIARIAREAAALKNDLQQTRVDLVTTSGRLEAYDGIQRDFERAQASIPPLQVQLQELEKECVMKDNELEDLKAWQKRVFTSMGLAPPAPGPAPTHATEGITNTAMDNLADASFLSSSEVFEEGSTPKRSKPRPSSKNLSTRTSYNNPSTIPKALSKRSKTQRSALRSISPNRRRTTVGVSVSERKYDEEGRQSLPLRKRRGSSQGGQKSDFEMSFATNTPFTPGEFAAGTGTWPPESGSMTEL